MAIGVSNITRPRVRTPQVAEVQEEPMEIQLLRALDF